MKPRLTFFGGIAEIGGNKILLEDGDRRVFLDMGAPFSRGEDYFAQYLGPRYRFGLRDFFALDLVPRIAGLYSEDALRHTDLPYEPASFHGIFITHTHTDHTRDLQWVDREIPVHMGEGTRTILQSWEETSSGFASLGEHDYRLFRTGHTVEVDGMEVEPIHVDHSVPAAYGYLFHTSAGTVAYTGDIRQHGPHAEMTREFIDRAAESRPVALITEGTRVAPEETRRNFTEAGVRDGVIGEVLAAKGKLVLCTFYPRDVDRMRTFMEAATQTERTLVLSSKAAHLLRALKADPHISVPDVEGDPNLLVYFREMARPKPWESELRAWLKDRAVDSTWVRQHREELILQVDFTHFTELIDIEPEPGGPFIHSMSEPFEEDDIEDKIKDNWLGRFGLVRKQYHASGHMSEEELGTMIKDINPGTVIPIHTQHPDRFGRLAKHVRQPELGRSIDLG